MINCTCVVQEGQSPDVRRENIQTLLNRFSTESFAEEPQIAWISVAPGNGFTAAKPSTSSVVAMTANQPLSPAARESLLRRLVDLWSTETGCTVDEIVAVIADPQSR